MRDVTEFLAELGPVAAAAPAADDASPTTTPATSRTPRASARSRARCCAAIPGLELREIAEAELCCGSAGIYNLLNPEPARELGDRKAANILATGAELLVTANPGCLMQVATAIERSGHPMGMAHTVEVLDASIRGLPGRPVADSTPSRPHREVDTMFQQIPRPGRWLTRPERAVRARSRCSPCSCCSAGSG